VTQKYVIFSYQHPEYSPPKTAFFNFNTTPEREKPGNFNPGLLFDFPIKFLGQVA
jgi:hypothetical protein